MAVAPGCSYIKPGASAVIGALHIEWGPSRQPTPGRESDRCAAGVAGLCRLYSAPRSASLRGAEGPAAAVLSREPLWNPPPRTLTTYWSHGIMDGTQLPRSIIEFYYKNDALNDPMVSEEHITAFGWATPQEIDDIMALAIRVNDFLSGLFLGVGIRLVDFKMETGRLWENDLMRIVVADEISPDSCRLWDIKSNEKLDKDRFRRDLGGLLEAYTEVAKRLGILMENERPVGSGPVLVKS